MSAAQDSIDNIRENRISSRISFLNCNSCGKQVSTGFYPVPTDMPDKGMIVRAWIECPECIQAKEKK
jgi:hypothetical protein